MLNYISMKRDDNIMKLNYINMILKYGVVLTHIMDPSIPFKI